MIGIDERPLRARALETLLDNIPDVVARYDLDFRHIYVSAAVTRVTGLESSHFIGKTNEELGMPPHLVKIWNEALSHVVREKSSRYVEFSYPRPDGSISYFRWHVGPELDENGEVTSILSIARDITAEKEAEASHIDAARREASEQLVAELRASNERLRVSEERLRRLVEGNIIGVLIANEQRITEANEAFLEIVGYDQDDLAAGRVAWKVMTPPEYLPLDYAAIEEMRRTWRCTPFEKEYIRKDGRRVPILIGASVLKDDPLEWVCFVLDLSIRKRFEREREALLVAERSARSKAEALVIELSEANVALNRSQTMLRRLVDGNIIGVVIANQEQITEANDAFLEIVGYDRNDLNAGRVRWKAMTPPEYLPLADSRMDALRNLGTVPPFEKEYVKKNGERVSVLMGASVVRTEPLEWVCFVLDLTAQKRSEREREELLAAEKDARARAEAALQAKEDFLATVSHELRGPLTSINGWVQLLEQGADAELTTLALQSMRKSIGTQIRMVDDLLDAVRLARGTMNLELELLDFASVVDDGVAATRPAAAAAELSMTCRASAGALVRGDRARLLQVVTNLVTNAVKFTPAGGSIDINLTVEGDQVILSVKDTGIGIEPEFHARLFERFTQSSPRTIKGLGLGLAIVRDIVERHGGSVSAASEGRGKGAEFFIRLPLAQGV